MINGPPYIHHVFLNLYIRRALKILPGKILLTANVDNPFFVFVPLLPPLCARTLLSLSPKPNRSPNQAAEHYIQFNNRRRSDLHASRPLSAEERWDSHGGDMAFGDRPSHSTGVDLILIYKLGPI